MKTQSISFALAAAVGAALTLTLPVRALQAADKEKAAYLGVAVGDVDDTLREQLRLDRGVGVRIETVVPDGPADKAGLKAHDILEKLNDQILFNAPQLAALVRSFAPGDKVTLALIRQGDRQTLEAALGETEIAQTAKSLFDVWDGTKGPSGLEGLFRGTLDKALTPDVVVQRPGKPSAYLGVELGSVDAALATQLGMDHAAGALINVVVDGSPAAKAELKQHDIVVKVDGKSIQDPADLSDRIGKHKKGDKVTLTIFRGGKPIEIEATLSERPAVEPPGLEKLLQEYRIVPRIRALRAGPHQDDIVIRLDSASPGDVPQVEHRVIVRSAESGKAADAQGGVSAHALSRHASSSQKVIVVKTEKGLTTTVTDADGKRHVTVQDAEGKVLFDGPVNSETDRAKLPDEARRNLEKIEQQIETNLDTESKEVIQELRLAPGPIQPDIL